MLPEMFIISFIMFNEIMLRLNGVYEKHEGIFETIYDGIERWKASGDEEKIRQAQERASNMDMAKYFKSYEEQMELIKQIENLDEMQGALKQE